MDSHEQVRRSYPLSVLFVLVAASAVVSALLTPVVRVIVAGELRVTEALLTSIGGALILMGCGAIVGLYHYRPVRGLLWGMLTGGLLGLVIGPVVMTPPEAIGSLTTMSLGGAIVLLITGAAFGTTFGD